ncbi:MAG TPA: hypothetical protein PLQ52_10670 [Lacunisphaera sp.]|jgi:hypothetical protein|nr:hypothetical protein [Lacunisphaera sp.]HQY06516.1 hypothetical protein [Lacunisphaera sp.]
MTTTAPLRLLCLFASAATLSAQTWQITTVDSTNMVGSHSSLAVSSSGTPHIAYQDNTNKDLRYATFDGSSWNITTVDATNNKGEHTSIQLTSAGLPVIAYRDMSAGNINYVAHNGTAWQTPVVAVTGNSGSGTISLALNASDQPSLSHYHYATTFPNGADLKSTSYNGSTWATSTVASTNDVGSTSSLALTSGGLSRIAYLDLTTRDINYATYNGSAWTTSTITNAGASGGSWLDLALDGSGNAHLAYYYSNAFGTGELRYTYYDGSAWQTATVDNSATNLGLYASLALDTAGQAHITYLNNTSGDLKYALMNGTTVLSTETVDALGNVGQWTDIELDGANGVHVSYYDYGNGDLKYAYLAAVPEPATYALCGGALALLATWRFRRPAAPKA